MKWYEKVTRFIGHTNKGKHGVDELIIFNFIKLRLTNKKRESIAGYLFIGLWVVGFLWLTLYPIIMSLIYSFATVTIPGGQGIQINFTGFDNFLIILNDIEFI